MKCVLIFLTLSVFISLTQCGKSTNPQLNNDLVGEWQWVSSVGGFGGETRTPETEGYDIVLRFNIDQTYTTTNIKDSNSRLNRGTYRINYEEINFPSPHSGYVIYMSSNRSQLDIEGNKLSIGDLHVDGFGHLYEKIEE